MDVEKLDRRTCLGIIGGLVASAAGCADQDDRVYDHSDKDLEDFHAQPVHTSTTTEETTTDYTTTETTEPAATTTAEQTTTEETTVETTAEPDYTRPSPKRTALPPANGTRVSLNSLPRDLSGSLRGAIAGLRAAEVFYNRENSDIRNILLGPASEELHLYQTGTNEYELDAILYTNDSGSYDDIGKYLDGRRDELMNEVAPALGYMIAYTMDDLEDYRPQVQGQYDPKITKVDYIISDEVDDWIMTELGANKMNRAVQTLENGRHSNREERMYQLVKNDIVTS